MIDIGGGGGTKQQNLDGLIWTFDPNDCILKDRYPALRMFIFSKYPPLLMAFMAIGWLTVVGVLHHKGNYEHFNAANFVSGIFMLLPSVSWCICVILGINRQAFHLVIRSPDIWVNIVAGLTFSSYNVMFWCQYQHSHSKGDDVHPAIQVINYTLSITMIVLSMVILSSIDGLPHFGGVSRLYAGMLTAVFLFCGSWVYELLDMQVEDIPITLFGYHTEISITTGLISSMRTLAGLMARQGLNSYLNQDRCVALSHQPKLRWTTDVNAEYHRMDDDADSSYSLMEKNATIQMGRKK